MSKQPGAVGQITLSRVLPGGTGSGHDRLRLTIYSKPPDLSGSDSVGAPAFLEGTRMAPAAYRAKLGSLMETSRSEIWQSVFRHGSIRQGDYVRVTWSKLDNEHLTARLDYLRNWLSGLYAQVAKRGDVARGLESWQIRNAAEEQASLVSITAYPDSAASYESFGSEQDDFKSAHPGKSYNVYRQTADASNKLTTTTQTVIYRVDLGMWK